MSAASKRRPWLAGLGRIGDGSIVRAAFYLLLAGTLAVLYVDYRELSANDAAIGVAPGVPVLPAFDPSGPATPAGPEVTSDTDLLRAPLTAALEAGGVLALTGTIDPGAASRVAAEIAARGEYVKVVTLDSPGGSVEDAIRIGQLLLERGFPTEVEAGALCASSCPLVLAGGRTRTVSAAAAVGVHQIYAIATSGNLPTGFAAAGNAMADAQRTTAAITRYLGTTGVDPAIWLHALETPPDRLYYLSSEELTRYRLATKIEAAAPKE